MLGRPKTLKDTERKKARQISLSDNEMQEIRNLKKELGLSSNSEVVREGIKELRKFVIKTT